MSPKLQSKYTIRWIDRLAEIPKERWNALVGPGTVPFLEWEWLNTLETSGSVTAQTGWLPQHLTVWADDQLLAAAPLYLKSHSYGEFVFDQQWAELAARLGIHYYPKLLGMIPLTPATGYRFLLHPQADAGLLTARLCQAIQEFCREQRISGCHFLFVDPQWQGGMEAQGYVPWLHHKYIWRNQGYQDFDHYLQDFTSHQRKNIRRERRTVTAAGLRMTALTGEAITKPLLRLMYHYYERTCSKFAWWGAKYLTPEFFEQLHPQFCHRLVLMAAFTEQHGDTPVGLSFCAYKDQHLYGRYWGTEQEIDCLHFETCYYYPVEWAIAQGLQSFDPGAGGEHKKRRGFPALANYSLHQLYDPTLAQIIYPYLRQSNALEQQEIDAINGQLPFHPKPSTALSL